MSERLFTADVLNADLALDRTLSLGTIGGTDIGVWEMTPGTEQDIEVDEVFVVLTGQGTVAFEDGEEIELAPGVAVRLRAGDRTTWTVTERLRKLYVARV